MAQNKKDAWRRFDEIRKMTNSFFFLQKMARRQQRSSGRSSTRPATRKPAAAAAAAQPKPVPAVAQPAAVPAQPPVMVQQPSLFGQMASTAAGVAVVFHDYYFQKNPLIMHDRDIRLDMLLRVLRRVFSGVAVRSLSSSQFSNSLFSRRRLSSSSSSNR